MTKPKRPDELIQNSRYGGRWTKAADEALMANYGEYLQATVANKINALLGTRFTKQAIDARAGQLGLSSYDCQGYLTISQAARQLNIERSMLHKYIISHKLKVTGHGHASFVTEETWRLVQEFYTIPPVATVTTLEAARRLHYSRESIIDQIKVGKLKAWKRGQQWRVSLADVERLERIQQGRTYIGDV